MSASDDLAGQVRAGVEALSAGRPHEAARALAPVVEDADFTEHPDLADVRARVYSLYAQALLDSGAARQADAWARRALKQAQDLGDQAGADEVRALLRQIFSAAVEEKKTADAVARVAATPLEALMAQAVTDTERAGVLVEKANAEVEVGRAEEGEALARQALALAQQAGSVREEVLAWLTLARACPDEAARAMVSAWRRACDADEANLVGAIARAAEHAGVTLPHLTGPALPGEQP